MSNRYETEIVRLHNFFVDWFTGTVPQTAEAFAPFKEPMSPQFAIISPQGLSTDCGQLVDSLWKSHNLIPNIRIWIKNVTVKQQIGDISIVTYEEWQERDGKTTSRVSTVIFQPFDHPQYPLKWLHVHETWMK